LQNHINYRYLWTGNLFANCAQWLQFITIGWLALDISGSALHSILTVAVRALPFLLLVKNGSDQFTGVVDQLMLA
jgi:branched-subunit amino acid transport protein AzlD